MFLKLLWRYLRGYHLIYIQVVLGLLYTGSTSTTKSGTAYLADYLQIQLPVFVIMANFTITPETGFNVRAPTLFYFAGSIDGNTWNLLYTGSLLLQVIQHLIIIIE